MDYYISDRRWKKCVHLLQSSAFLNGRKQIDLTDIPILIHCLWNKSETIPTIIDIVCSSITSPIDAKVVKYGKDIDQALNCIRKNSASSNSQEIDEDNYVQVNFFYYNVLKYYKGKTLFYKMDYSHVPSNQTCDGILYYDETKQAHIIHAIYTGQLYDYKMKNTQEVNKVKLSKCHGGIVIDNIPYAFQTKRANAEPTIFNQPGCPSPNTALKILNDIRNELLVKLSNQQKLFDYYRNLFLSDDDIKIVKQYLSQCEKSLKEMEVKAQNASLLLC
jgi:MoxR-like ATPase